MAVARLHSVVFFFFIGRQCRPDRRPCTKCVIIIAKHLYIHGDMAAGGERAPAARFAIRFFLSVFVSSQTNKRMTGSTFALYCEYFCCLISFVLLLFSLV